MSASSYDFKLLKQTREKKKLKILDLALNLCLGERHIVSLEENSLDYFLSDQIRMVALKKYSIALGLDPADVIFSASESYSRPKEANIENEFQILQDEEADPDLSNEIKKPNFFKRLFGLI